VLKAWSKFDMGKLLYVGSQFVSECACGHHSSSRQLSGFKVLGPSGLAGRDCRIFILAVCCPLVQLLCSGHEVRTGQLLVTSLTAADYIRLCCSSKLFQ